MVLVSSGAMFCNRQWMLMCFYSSACGECVETNADVDCWRVYILCLGTRGSELSELGGRRAGRRAMLGIK